VDKNGKSMYGPWEQGMSITRKGVQGRDKGETKKGRTLGDGCLRTTETRVVG